MAAWCPTSSYIAWVVFQSLFYFGCRRRNCCFHSSLMIIISMNCRSNLPTSIQELSLKWKNVRGSRRKEQGADMYWNGGRKGSCFPYGTVRTPPSHGLCQPLLARQWNKVQVSGDIFFIVEFRTWSWLIYDDYLNYMFNEAVQFARSLFVRYTYLIFLICSIPESHLAGMIHRAA